MGLIISAVVCTHNRAGYLGKAVRSLVAQTLPKKDYEIIVVDNASDCDIAEIINGFTGKADIHLIRESRLGLSYARNAGWRAARGEYVAFLDDDAVASENWLESILKVFEKTRPKPGCLTGKVEPIWEVPRPAWLSDSQLGYLAILNWSDSPRVLSKEQWLSGANMMFPKSILEEYKGFDPNLGRRGAGLRSGEDILMQRQLINGGHVCLYRPEIVVSHHIPASRLSIKWMIKRAFWQGVSDGFINTREEAQSVLRRLTKGLAALLRILLSPRELFSLVAGTEEPDRVSRACSVAARMGGILVLWGIVR